MPAPWAGNVAHIKPGEPVSASVAGRPDRALTQRTQYLKDRLDAIAAGRAIFDIDATLAPHVQEGQPVFWNPEQQRYEPAFAAVEPDEASGTLVPRSSADVSGIVSFKKNTTLGDVILMGLMRLGPIANAIDGDVLPGRYYLSSTTPGTLVRQRPPVSVPVCLVHGPKANTDDQDPWVLVWPQQRDFLEDHIHYRFELAARPAGTVEPPDPGAIHIITDPDDEKQGWLPADHASFNGLAPTGAAFGYNLAAHPELARVWPPIPLAAVAVLWDKGKDHLGATEVPLGLYGLIVCDAAGIWWMSNCNGDVPWPADYDNTAGDPEVDDEINAEPECPRDETMRIVLAYVRMVFATDKSVVTSLRAAEGSPLRFFNAEGDEATTGDLFAAWQLDFLIDEAPAYGSLVLKELGSNNKFKAGRVLEGIIVDGDGLTVASTHSRLLDPEDEESALVHQGIATLSVNLEPADRELTPQIIKLGDVQERTFKDFPVLGLPAARNSALLYRFNVPPVGLPSNPKVKLRVVLFGHVTASIPNLPVGYKRLTRPNAGPQSLPANFTTIAFASAQAVTAEEAVEVESAEFTVAAGDTVVVSLSRTSGGGYPGEIAIVRTSLVLTGG